MQVEQITEKSLFFADDMEQKVDELNSFLQPEKYHQIQERMKQEGFRNELARQTGRQIMVVDVPQIKSKWVGESEKNIKALFDRYRELVKRAKQAPILLFNEADAIIGIRMNGAQHAVDKMENSIQNIILQEMETLDGIMIATTNLQQNLDTAFERRFLYKIKFEKPDATVRRKIWQKMIPELSDHDATKLAEKFDFSGGQIENVARKYSINSILHGEIDTPLEVLNGYAKEDRCLPYRRPHRPRRFPIRRPSHPVRHREVPRLAERSGLFIMRYVSERFLDKRFHSF